MYIRVRSPRIVSKKSALLAGYRYDIVAPIRRNSRANIPSVEHCAKPFSYVYLIASGTDKIEETFSPLLEESFSNDVNKDVRAIVRVKASAFVNYVNCLILLEKIYLIFFYQDTLNTCFFETLL